MIVIIDYGLGNLGSIKNMLKRIGVESAISDAEAEIARADKLILPGVGSFDRAMANLHESGLIPLLNDKVLKERTPTLGICLGMQLMTGGSEEGRLDGLGWIDARAERFNFNGLNSNLKIPHMGWNNIAVRQTHPLFTEMTGELRYYFVHSFHVRCADPSSILATTDYGLEFTSAFFRENIIGIQFHPEKSHRYGFALLKNFAEL